MIGIIDYGMGNLYSVSKALERLGYEYVISEHPNELKQTKGLILPGVGSFNEGTPLLGICLGMQLLFDESEENGLTEGLGLLRGRVVRIPGVTASGERYKVPLMGWNRLVFRLP